MNILRTRKVCKNTGFEFTQVYADSALETIT